MAKITRERGPALPFISMNHYEYSEQQNKMQVEREF
jgi:hypothetical protein